MSLIQVSYYYISNIKQNITLALETLENNTFCLKLGQEKKQINDAVKTTCSYLVHAHATALSRKTTRRNVTLNQEDVINGSCV